jgi:hypothetical protein
MTAYRLDDFADVKAAKQDAIASVAFTVTRFYIAKFTSG